MTPFKGKFGPDGIKVLPRSPLKRELLENPALRETPPSLRDQLTDFPGYMLGLPEKAATETHPLRNPFDISRASLLDQVKIINSYYSYASVYKIEKILFAYFVFKKNNFYYFSAIS